MTFVVFVIMIQHIFHVPSQFYVLLGKEAPTHSTIVIRGLWIHLFLFTNEVDFSSQ